MVKHSLFPLLEKAFILEFDFVPSVDTVKFNYVFASEEYLDFVNSTYNDVFIPLYQDLELQDLIVHQNGFPGEKKYSEVPNSSPSLPITISTVNDTLNSQYYNYDTLGIVSAFNGFTDVFTGSVGNSFIIPCNVYHIKLAIYYR